MKFTWIPFYEELADKLMDCRHDRNSLLDFIYSHRDEFSAGYLHDNNGRDDLLTDVDPFSVFGLFNRGIKPERRTNSLQLLKKQFNIEKPLPQDFDGIPRLNNINSFFFGFRGSRGEEDIENLWILFEKVIQNEDIEEIFNKVIQQFSLKIKITMGLFWIRPDRFLAFDKVNSAYVGAKFGIRLPAVTPEYKAYQKIIDSVREKMVSQGNAEHPFAELSANANQDANGSTEISNNSSADYRINLWKRRKNLVLQGAPGTGKTYQVPELVVRFCCPNEVWNSREELLARYNQLKNDRRVMFTTFHQSMDYEDWMEGLRPVVENNQVCYEIVPGIFKRLCDEAEVENTKPYVVVIDELNRGNVAKIFGELITLLEPDKRKGMTSAESVVLPYSKKPFFVPDNVYVLATMNTADRSLGNMDYAIRRRFAFVTVRPRGLDNAHFRKDYFREVSSLFIANYEDYAKSGFDQGFQLERADTLCEEYRPEDVWIGHSYFLVADESEMNDRLRYEIIPLLEQYVRDGVLTEAAKKTIDELSERAEN